MAHPETRPGQPINPFEQEPISREEKVKGILERRGAVLTEGHFVYTTGRHGEAYINKDAIYPHTEDTRELCGMWAGDFADKGVDTVVAPAMGGVILSHVTAHEMSKRTGREVASVYAEKGPEDSFVFTRGYDKFVKDKRVLVVEDVLTTGGSVKKVIELVRKTGGEVVGLGAIANRGNVKPEDVGVDHINALINVQMESWPEDECIKCKEGVPVDIRAGKGKEYLQRKQQ